MKIQIIEGDDDVVKNPQYKKMMKQVKRFTRQGGELDPEALLELQKMEMEAQQSKGKKKQTPESVSTTSDQTKRARATKKASNGDDEFEIGGADDDDDDNDDDDENKILPSFISDALEDAEEGANAPHRTVRPEKTQSSGEADQQYIDKIEEILQRESDNGLRPSVPAIFVQNMVATAQTNMFININMLLPYLAQYGVAQNKKRFIAMTQRTTNPRSSTLSFRNGKFVNTGSRTEKDARMSIQTLIDKIASVEFQTAPGVYVRPYADMKIEHCVVHNIVGSTTVPFEIDLSFLAQYEFVYYFKMLFVGAIVSVYGISNQEIDRKVKILVFGTGNIVCTGAKTVEHIKLVFELLYPYLSRAAVQSSLPAELRTTKSRKRRLDQDKRKVKAVPHDSTSIIHLDADYMIDEFCAVNAGRETAQQTLERQREQQRGTLAGLSKTTLNVVAMDSMVQERQRQEEEQQMKKRRLLTNPGDPKNKKSLKISLMDSTTAKMLAQNH